MKDFFYVVGKLYNYKIIGLSIILFLAIYLINIEIFPDWFDFRDLKDPSNLIITLLSIIIGTSSIILTILLVVYESLSKPFRRNSLDIILDDPWIRLLFSLFGGTFIYLSLTLLVIKKDDANTDLALLYTSCIITFFFILLQFPLVILALRYSKSHRFINKIIEEISLNDIDEIFDPPKVDDNALYFEKMEKNKLMLLKEIGIVAIKENDWSMPQYILNGVYESLIKSTNKEIQEKRIIFNVHSFIWICKHFSKYAIENSDLMTTKQLFSVLYGVHIHLVNIGFRPFRKLPIDECIINLQRGVSSNNDFYSMQSYLLRDSCEVITYHMKSLKFSNEEWPTLDYNLDRIENKEERIQISEAINDYRFYITKELPDIFFNILKYAIETKNKSVYNHSGWQINPLLSSIYSFEDLTNYQKEEIFHDYYFKSKRIYDDAFQNGIYEETELSANGNFYIEQWLRENREYAFWCLNDAINRVFKLEKMGKLTSFTIDNLFVIARGLAKENMNDETKRLAFNDIIKCGFDLLKDKNTTDETRKEIVRQLKWLNSYLKNVEELESLKKEYSLKIDRLK